MIWSKKCVLKFIEAYKEQKLLWDPSHKNHYNKVLKQEAWKELSIEMQCNVDELRRKMNYLLAARRREKAKMIKNSATEKGTEEVYRKSWFAFKHMEFLTKRKKRKRIISEGYDIMSKNMTSKTDEINQNNDVAQNIQPTTLTTESNNETKHNNAIDSTKSPIMKTRIRTPEPILKSTSDLQESSAPAITAVSDSTVKVIGLDQYQLYANYLAGKFRGYSNQTYIAVEYQINNLLHNADCGHYDSTFRRPQTPTALKNIEQQLVQIDPSIFEELNSSCSDMDDSSVVSDNTFNDVNTASPLKKDWDHSYSF